MPANCARKSSDSHTRGVWIPSALSFAPYPKDQVVVAQQVLMDNAPTKSGIPSLRDSAGQWVHDGHVKVELFANALSSKFVLHDAVEEHPVANDEPLFQMLAFVLIRET